MAATQLLTDDVRRLTRHWLQECLPEPLYKAVSLGLPEWDDRLDCWRVAVVPADSPGQAVGESKLIGAAKFCAGLLPRWWTSG